MGGWTRDSQRCSRKATLESQGTWLENWLSDSQKEVQLTLSQGKKKKGDKVDDAVRTRVSQDRVTAALFTELFLSTQYI